MTTVFLRFHSVNEVRDFVEIVNHYSYPVDLVEDRFVVDGKSIMGIFSLNLQAPVEAHIHTDDPGPILAELERFMY